MLDVEMSRGEWHPLASLWLGKGMRGDYMKEEMGGERREWPAWSKRVIGTDEEGQRTSCMVDPELADQTQACSPRRHGRVRQAVSRVYGDSRHYES